MTETITETTIEPRPTLMVVDDVVTNIDMLVRALGKDYSVRVATNGAQGPGQREKGPARSDPPGCDDAGYRRLRGLPPLLRSTRTTPSAFMTSKGSR